MHEVIFRKFYATLTFFLKIQFIVIQVHVLIVPLLHPFLFTMYIDVKEFIELYHAFQELVRLLGGIG